MALKNQINNHGPTIKGPAELNQDAQNDKEEMRGGVTSDGEDLLEEDESQINGNMEDINTGQIEAAKGDTYAQVSSQRTQQPPKPSLVRWERFLPLRSLKVLLVENDDSTRHVVSALLQNCGYAVIAVSNGLQAWKILEDLTSNIDLVLTEVVIPRLTGIGLLSKIMSHKTCRNIPVIMMSSHDSMNIVFKCLSKGSVDFLVKPVRKNELKNLWQHVWRKCRSSSGSGSESGIRTQKSMKSESVEHSDYNSGSYDVDENQSINLNARDGSNKGSGTQSSWTKTAVEVDSPKPLSPGKQLADPPDITCAQVTFSLFNSRPEALSNNFAPVTPTAEGEAQDDGLDNMVNGEAMETKVPAIPALHHQSMTEEVPVNDKCSEPNKRKDIEQEKGLSEFNNENPNGKSRNQTLDPAGATIDVDTNPSANDIVGIPNTRVSNTHKNTCQNKVFAVESGLKRLRASGESAPNAHQGNVFRHSDVSAFSRYNSASTTNQAPTGIVSSCSPLNNSPEAAKTEYMQSNSNGTPNQGSNGSSNYNDLGSTTNNAFTKPSDFIEKAASRPSVKCLQPSSYQQGQDGAILLPPPMAQANTKSVDVKDLNQHTQVQHHHYHHHHHHHHVHNMGQHSLANHDDQSLQIRAVAAINCGSSNMMGASVNGKIGEQSLNGSASGSNQGSNIQIENSATLKGTGTNRENISIIAAKVGRAIGVGLSIGTGTQENRISLREAALKKFRQKRKQRCFEKKVRYQSRKKLAEQRPRIRGQFVRHAVHDKIGKDHQ